MFNKVLQMGNALSVFFKLTQIKAIFMRLAILARNGIVSWRREALCGVAFSSQQTVLEADGTF